MPSWSAGGCYAFGPATVTDIKWWFGNTLGWARQALRDIDAVEVDMDGTPGYVLPDDVELEPEAPTVVCAASRPGRHDDGLVRPRLVSRRRTAARCSIATAMAARRRG